MIEKYTPVTVTYEQSLILTQPKSDKNELIDINFGLWIHQQFDGLYDLSEQVIANIEQERLQRIERSLYR